MARRLSSGWLIGVGANYVPLAVEAHGCPVPDLLRHIWQASISDMNSDGRQGTAVDRGAVHSLCCSRPGCNTDCEYDPGRLLGSASVRLNALA